jgi:hypothetical protein
MVLNIDRAQIQSRRGFKARRPSASSVQYIFQFTYAYIIELMASDRAETIILTRSHDHLTNLGVRQELTAT